MSIKVEHAGFLVSATGPKSWPAGRGSEIAFAGRSNVGKSSLINSLLGRRALARVSGTPGRTRTINFLDVRLGAGSPVRTLRMVDLPGYGYAKVSHAERQRWGPMIETYVTKRGDLVLVVLIVDARRPPTELDLRMARWLDEVGRPWLCVVTKLDKLPKTKRAGAVRAAERALDLDPGVAVGFSAVDGTGREAVWRRLLRAFARSNP